MGYMLGVVIIASRTGNAPSLLASFLSVSAFNFFFVPHTIASQLHDVKYFMTFIVCFIVAFVISRLTVRIREQPMPQATGEEHCSTLSPEPGIGQGTRD